MENIKVEKKKILLYILLIMAFIGISFFAFSDLSTVQNYRDRIAEEKIGEEITEETAEEEPSGCQLPYIFEHLDKIETIISEDGSNKILLETYPHNDPETGKEFSGCSVDVIDKIAKAFGDEFDSSYLVEDAIYLGEGSIAYRYRSMIYTQQLKVESKPTPIFGKEFTDSKAWEALFPYMSGPYLVYGEANGKASESFLFTVHFVWGCEEYPDDSDDEHCARVYELTKQFCNVDKIPGLWEYNIKTGKLIPIKTGDCNL